MLCGPLSVPGWKFCDCGDIQWYPKREEKVEKPSALLFVLGTVCMSLSVVVSLECNHIEQLRILLK